MERKFFALLAGTLLLIICVVGGWWLMQPREPIYHGKRIGYWINRPGDNSGALGYFPQVDSNAIPFLVNALRTHNGVLARAYARACGAAPGWLQPHLATPVKIADWMVRANAAQVLGRIGTNSPPAIRGLMRVLQQDDVAVVRVYAVESLQQIAKGNEMVAKAMIIALHDQAPEVRDAAGDALWQIDPTAAKALLK